MPKRTRSQLSRNSSQARAIKIRRHGESQSETENRLASQREYADQPSLRSNIASTLNIDLIKELQTTLNSHNI
ncbi:unnamed protein product [Macrosiphum euphorbiae]|uniref:Uncharacterized protein n=1 Tax=Macrosiphum euphorbiae TaxID=13131 RepID=A0AAV0W7J8_9HEMI|nr:unnamed protein product [Macrosiphum euphorbiae]